MLTRFYFEGGIQIRPVGHPVPNREVFGLGSCLFVWALVWLVVTFSAPAFSATRILIDDIGGVKEFDEVGNYLGFFGDTAGAGLNGLAFHPVSRNLFGGVYAAGVLEFDGVDGTLIATFGETAANLLSPRSLAFHPTTGDLFVLDNRYPDPDSIRRFDGTTGAYLGIFGETAANLNRPRKLTFHPTTGNLFVLQDGNNRDVREFHGSTGLFLGVLGQTTTQLSIGPRDMAFDPDSGNLFVADRLADAIEEFDGTTGAFLNSHTLGGALVEPALLAFGSLYVEFDSPDCGEILVRADLSGASPELALFFGEGHLISPGALVVDDRRGPDDTLTTDNQLNDGSSADPVSTFTGELFQGPILDLFLRGPMGLYFSRYYASRIRSDGNIRSFLGDNWLHNFDMRLRRTGNTIKVVTNRGRVIRFQKNGGSWDLNGKSDILFQLAEMGADFLLLDPRSDRIHTFDSGGKLTKIEDGRGNVHTLTYDAFARLSKVSDGLGRSLDFTYSCTRLTEVTDGSRTITFAHTGEDLTSVTDARGNTTTYSYEPGSLMTSMTLPRGNVPFTQTWNGDSRVATQTDAGGNTFTFAYAGAQTTVTDPLGNTTVQTHSAGGELTGFQGEDGVGSSLAYDPTGKRTEFADRLGRTTAISHDGASGKVISVTLADGGIMSFGLTARAVGPLTFHDLTSVMYPDGTSESFAYDAVGNLTSRTDRNGSMRSFTHDGLGQILTANNPLGGVTTQTYNADGSLASRTDAVGNTTTFGYDPLRRLITLSWPDATTRTFTYDANDNLLSTTDERGNTTTFTHDANNNPVTITDPTGNVTSFAYDALDRLLSATDPLGSASQRTYDELGRIESRTDRSGNTTTADYDARGRPATFMDPAGHSWSQTYDLENVLASATNPLGNTKTFTSDEMGRITRAATPLATTAIDYDLMGRVTSWTDPLGESVARIFNALGLPVSTTLPEGIAAGYVRNDLGQVTEITDPNGNAWARGYDAQSRPVSWTDPLGHITTLTYESRGRISQIDLPASTLDFTYDGTGNVIRRLYSDGTDLGFSYDVLGRLTSADGLALAYDANGRLTASNGISLTRDPAGRIATINPAPGKTLTYTYDSRGLLTGLTDWTPATTLLSYDDAGRLTTITRPNGSALTSPTTPTIGL